MAILKKEITRSMFYELLIKGVPRQAIKDTFVYWDSVKNKHLHNKKLEALR